LNGNPNEIWQINQLSDLYYSLIPHSFGRRRPPIINGPARLKKEVELLESLSDMRIAEEIMKQSSTDIDPNVNPLDNQFENLGMREMTPLDETSTEFHEIHEYLMRSVGATHYSGYKVEDVFRIERNGEFDRFDKSEFGNLDKKNRRLLWYVLANDYLESQLNFNFRHGSRSTNFGGILSQGLRIAPPEAPVSGYMFGKGIYLADMSSKSANYCNSYSSAGIGLLLLCEAELGSPMLELTQADYNAGDRARTENKVATWGKGTTAPTQWKDAGCIHESLIGVAMVSEA
jgi:poly [ADP-ribose] polymerase